MKILFVCTGNTCRSPMASALFSRQLQSGGIKLASKNIEVSTAGLFAQEGGQASPLAKQVMQEIGLDISPHRTTPLQTALLTEADLILTMTETQKDLLQRMRGDLNLPVYTLAEYAGDAALEVPDPYGQDINAYRHTLAQLDYLVDRLLRKIIESD
ncbi:MAG: low molecular weight protein arginine phosphatase [Syntrophomonadaceae bacterium]|nr:low molecular weight protein arginine phosphatase [Syntrophomonadaceae bacterium]